METVLLVASIVISLGLIAQSIFSKQSWLYLIVAVLVGYYAFSGLTVSYVIYLVGLLLVTIEFYIPSTGVTGIIGMLVWGISLGEVMPDGEVYLITVILSILTTAGVFYANLKAGRRIELGRGMVLEKGIEIKETKQQYVGQTGVVERALRPSGKVKLPDGEVHNAMSDGEYIAEGHRVSIYRQTSNQLYVRPYRAENEDTDTASNEQIN